MVEERLVAPGILTFSVQSYRCLLTLIPQTTNLVKRPGENNNHSHGQTLCQGGRATKNLIQIRHLCGV